MPAVVVTGALAVRRAPIADAEFVVEAVENQYLGVRGVETAHQRMRGGQFAEVAAERDLLGGVEVLVAEEDDAVLDERGANVGDRRGR